MPSETLEENDMKELERKPYSSESMRVRCPHCRKLYMVQLEDVKEARPRFECVECHNRFWLTMSDLDLSAEINGIPMQFKEVPKRDKRGNQTTHPCPKCFKPVVVGEAECVHCGVVFAKLKEMNFVDEGPNRSDNLSGAWKKVMSNYGDNSIHSDFLRLAQRENNLPFAAAQYGHMSKLMPGDDATEKHVREVQALGSALLPPPKSEGRPKIRASRFYHVPLFLGVVMILAGMAIPPARNVVGIGAAFIFLGIAGQLSRPAKFRKAKLENKRSGV